MKAPKKAQILGMTPTERMIVRKKALALNNDLGRETVELIDSMNVPLSEGAGGMSEDHPLYIEMQEVIWSAEGKAAAISAAQSGLPAMAGIDPLLQKKMGQRYGTDQQGTVNAGSIVAELMRHLGYEKHPDGQLPGGCVAQTAAMWKPKSPHPAP